MKELDGVVERVTFFNPQTQFTVAKIQEPSKKGLTSIVGKMPPLQPGESVRCSGSWVSNPSHGQQFEVASLSVEAPATATAIEKYLGSGMIRGIGPVYAKKIVAHFGASTLDVLDQAPRRLGEIPGIGPKRVSQVKESWEEHQEIRNVMLFLQGVGVSPAYAQRIFQVYGQESVAKVKENPYRLAREVARIGFRHADRVAGEMGIEKDSPERIDAGIEFVLDELGGEGHVCYPVTGFVERAQRILEVEVAGRLDALVKENRIVIEEEMIWSRVLYLTEEGIAREVRRIQEGKCFLRSVDGEKAVRWVEERLRLKLASLQKEAVARALSDKVLIITGGPGTGKSTITRAILRITRELTAGIILAAPTGRAAKRMSEITGRGAKTIHSLLEFDFKRGGFKKGWDDPLKGDLIIVDEASMIDTSLMYSLLKAVPSHARLLLIGDIDQLPSVGPGNVLRDMITSDVIPSVCLTQIFRQAKGSRIITNAHRVNEGIFPELESEPDSDFFFVEEEDPDKLRERIVDLVANRLPSRYGFDPLDQIQVLAPMKRGPIGIEQLNSVLQKALNPNRPVLFDFAVGDKVMQTRNNYDKEVYNGDVGKIATMGDEIVVHFDGRPVVYQANELYELMLAYAVSVHKYQGSECPCIVMPIHTSHFKLLHRNLLYTGITRARKLVVLLGSKKALGIAINTNEVQKRYTGLKERLQCNDL